ncbi:MAG: 1-deoxy-D-xylulose-5-phosphate synthase [Planctomycetia bacterium]
MKTRIMYIEDKSADGINGPGRIGSVTLSKTGATLYYAGRSFRSLKGYGFKANYYDVASGAEFWISGPRKDGRDRLYGGTVEIDDDAREEYWTKIRRLRRCVDRAGFAASGKNR